MRPLIGWSEDGTSYAAFTIVNDRSPRSYVWGAKSLFTPRARTREQHHRDDLGAKCERYLMPRALESAAVPQVA